MKQWIWALAFGYTLFTGCTAPDPALPNAVEVSTTAAVAAAPFTAVCYHPVAKGDTVRSFTTLDTDLALMQEAGIDAIRVYEPIDDRAVLDAIAAAGMKVITGFGYNQKGKNDLLSGTYIDYVKRYKDHPAMFIWELGNEYNYHPEWFDGDLNVWYATLSAAISEIKAIDTLHLVATAHGEIPDSTALEAGKELDIWGFNVYRWDLPASFVKDWQAISDQPFYFSELGADSYMKVAKDGFEQGENERAQAQAVGHILEELAPHHSAIAGLTLFSFTDGWWKAGNPDTQDVGGYAPNSSGVPYDGAPNEEFWGMVDIDRNKKEVFDVIAEHFNGIKKTEYEH